MLKFPVIITDPSQSLKLPVWDVSDQTFGMETISPQNGVPVSAFSVYCSMKYTLCVNADCQIKKVNFCGTVFQAESDVGVCGV